MDFLNHSKRKQVTLRGASKQESSRAEDLLRAKEERATRKAVKREQAAALTVQRVWRGASARGATRRELCLEWIAKYAECVATQDRIVQPQQLAGVVLPPILLALKAPKGLQGCEPSTLPAAWTKDTAALRGVLALVLRSLGTNQAENAFFALALDRSNRAALLSSLERLAALCCSVIGSPTCDALTQLAAARVLSLLTDASKWRERLQAAATAEGAAAEPAAVTTQKQQDEPQQQQAPLPHLSFHQSCTPPTASASFFTPEAGRPAVLSGGGAVAAGEERGGEAPLARAEEAFLWVLHQWLGFMAASPQVVQAVRRLAELADSVTASPDPAAPPPTVQSSTRLAGGGAVGVGLSAARGGGGAVASRQQLTSMLNTLTLTQLRLWQQLSRLGPEVPEPAQKGSVQHGLGGEWTLKDLKDRPAGSGCPGPPMAGCSTAGSVLPAAPGQQRPHAAAPCMPQHAQRALNLLTAQVLTLPNLLTALSPPLLAKLTGPGVFLAVLGAVPRVGVAVPACTASRGRPVDHLSADQGTPPALDRGAALWLLANLTGLLAGKKVRKGGRSAGGSTHDDTGSGPQAPLVDYLPPSQLLITGPECKLLATEFATAATALLRRGSAAGSAARRAGAALQALWPFAEGSFAAQLLGVLPLGSFCTLYYVLLTTLDAASAKQSKSGRLASLPAEAQHGAVGASASAGGASSQGGAGSAEPRSGGNAGGRAEQPLAVVHPVRVLSALAFATPLLPQLWRWLSVTVGFPREAPAQATRGWDIPTLGLGMQSVAPAAAEGLGLFCRVYAHYLMVTDDYEFHEKQPLLSLGSQRAIAATLNTLIFRTHLPAGPQHAQQGKAAVRYDSKGAQYSMLAEHAPVLLRAMYQRDARRAFCPPLLWLEPYQHSISVQKPDAVPPSSPAHPSAQPPTSMAAPPRQGGSVGDGSQGDGGRLRGLFRGLTAGRSRQGSSQEAAPSAQGGGGSAVGRGDPAHAEALLVHGWFGGGQGEGRGGTSGRAVAEQHVGSGGPGEGDGVGGFSAAAVVRALLVGHDAAAGGGSMHSVQSGAVEGPGSAAQQGRLGGRHGALSAAPQPTALAAILLAAPQCVPFEERVSVFRALIDMDKERGRYHLAPVDGGPRPQGVTIRRGYILEDALSQLPRSGDAVKARLHVTFMNSQGLQEAGVDMGGLMKELVETVVQEGSDINRGLFSATREGYAYPNPLAEQVEGGLAVLELLGLVLGKALYEGILVDLPLAPFLVSRLQGRWPLFDELADLDPQVYRSLVQLKRYEGNVEELALDFTVESDCFGTRVSEELIPGGTSVAVTSANVLQYVFLVADWHLNKRLGVAARAFGSGLAKVIPPSWLRLFSPKELNQLLGGGEGGDIDVADMMRYTQYSGGYTRACTAVKMFWRVVEGLSQGERHSLLKFVTSCSRAPLGGFKHLNPPFTIHQVDCGGAPLALLGGKDVDRLPSASTCYNMLKLPNYRKAGTMRDKLLYAIQSGAGFELS